MATNVTLPRRLGAALAASLALSAAVPGVLPAAADGVVMKSSSPAYARGARVTPGQELRLTAGEQITILDQSGEKIIVTATGPYKPGAAGGGPAPSAEQVKADALKSAFLATLPIGVGTVGTQAGCIAAATAGGALSEAGCRIAFPSTAKAARPVNPHIDVDLATEAREIAPRASVPMVVSTSFNAAVACSLGSPMFAGTNADIPLSLAGSSVWFTLRTKADDKPGETDYNAPAPDKPGKYTVTCRAVDPETWRVANEAAGDLPFGDFTEMLRGYAGVRGAAFAENTIEFTVGD